MERLNRLRKRKFPLPCTSEMRVRIFKIFFFVCVVPYNLPDRFFGNSDKSKYGFNMLFFRRPGLTFSQVLTKRVMLMLPPKWPGMFLTHMFMSSFDLDSMIYPLPTMTVFVHIALNQKATRQQQKVTASGPRGYKIYIK